MSPEEPEEAEKPSDLETNYGIINNEPSRMFTHWFTRSASGKASRRKGSRSEGLNRKRRVGSRNWNHDSPKLNLSKLNFHNGPRRERRARPSLARNLLPSNALLPRASTTARGLVLVIPRDPNLGGGGGSGRGFTDSTWHSPSGTGFFGDSTSALQTLMSEFNPVAVPRPNITINVLLRSQPSPSKIPMTPELPVSGITFNALTTSAAG
ncbi:hypothetical protein B0H16DRAFT_1467695 [Mycena metata]|uniref:Uncharacterized protein n=1 Tax=Mycena metata TaxID=1033252 RepID=A0AAD7MUX3_9AGAR|nr:hypothetical protein B0H16DRAFT_1467695 [Mycena metata]